VPGTLFYKAVSVKNNTDLNQAALDLLPKTDGILSMHKTDEESSEVIVHGHYTTWGLGINAFSEGTNIWDEYSCCKWILELAEGDLPDDQYLLEIKNRR